MKKQVKKWAVLFGAMLLVTAVGAGITSVTGGEDENKEEDVFIVATSFYPVYIIAQNLTEGVRGVKVINMTENQGTCLHDYQMTTKDMKSLEQADVFIKNGAGMESFMDDIVAVYPQLAVIDSSQGLEDALISGFGVSMEGSAAKEWDRSWNGEQDLEDGNIKEHGHEHPEAGSAGMNGHIWMDPALYRMQVDNIAAGLSKADPAHTGAYQENARRYEAKVEELEKELDALTQQDFSQEVIIFHDAFSYLARRLGMSIIYGVELEADTALSAGETARIIEEARAHQVRYLFTEKQLQDAVTERIAEESGAKLCTIDSLVGGPKEPDAYLDGMRENIRILKEIFMEEIIGTAKGDSKEPQ